jgi:hypothetical protein
MRPSRIRRQPTADNDPQMTPIYADEQGKTPMTSTNLFRLVCRFAGELGWHGLVQTDLMLTPDNCGDFPPGVVVTCFSTSHLRFFIQINQAVAGEFGQYKVSVVAERYDIRPLDPEPCTIRSFEDAIRESRRLYLQFGRANFRKPEWRRRYLEQHPHKLWRKKKKRRGWKARLGFINP